MNDTIINSLERLPQQSQSENITSRTMEELFEDLRRPDCSNRPLIENRLFQLNARLAINLALKFTRNSSRQDDLVSEAMIALLKAIRSFKGGSVPFRAYAYQKVRWQLISTNYEDNEFGFRGTAARMLARARRDAWRSGQNDFSSKLDDDGPSQRMLPFVAHAVREEPSKINSDHDDAFSFEQVASDEALPDHNTMLKYDSQEALAIGRELLSTRNYEIFCQLLGIDGRPQSKPALLALQYGITQQRVSQIWADAIKRIRMQFITHHRKEVTTVNSIL